MRRGSLSPDVSELGPSAGEFARAPRLFPRLPISHYEHTILVMNNLYAIILLFLTVLLPSTARANSNCDCTVTTVLGAVVYSPACYYPSSVCTLDLSPGLGRIELFQFSDLRGVTVNVGSGTLPVFLASTLVSAGTSFVMAGSTINIDIVAAGSGNLLDRITGPNQLGLLNDRLFGLKLLACVDINLNLVNLLGPSISGCTLGDAGSTLPVELVSWSASPARDGVLLDWVTLRERDASHFRIWHSSDGVHYRKLARVNAAGTTEERSEYLYLHRNPAPGLHYYRLEEVDFDRSQQVFDLVSVEWPAGRDGSGIWPNPVRGGESIHLPVPDGGFGTATLFGAGGQVFATLPVSENGQLRMPPQLPAGSYYVRYHDTAARVLVAN